MILSIRKEVSKYLLDAFCHITGLFYLCQSEIYKLFTLAFLYLMNINRLHLITFSPTHTSRRIGEAVMRGIDCASSVVTDVTLTEAASLEIPANEMAVMVMPVYGGHIPLLAASRVANIHAQGAPVVVIAVYGNRAYEHALTDLDTLAGTLGFKVIAAGTFIGEHSYATPDNPIALGRPDADDLAEAELFGQKIRTKLTQASDLEHLYPVNVARIRRPSQPIWPLLRFVYAVMRMRKHPQPSPKTPIVDEALCRHCGLCVKRCPTQAIIAGDECHTADDKCLRCCACVKQCPHGARSFPSPFAQLLAKYFQKEKENRIII